MHEKENQPTAKQTAYLKAFQFWQNGNLQAAENHALLAMQLGSKTAAPQLLEKIAEKTRSKDTSITLSSYYLDQHDLSNAEKWAKFALQFGSKSLAQKRLAEIEARKNALTLQELVENFSPPADENPGLKIQPK